MSNDLDYIDLPEEVRDQLRNEGKGCRIGKKNLSSNATMMLEILTKANKPLSLNDVVVGFWKGYDRLIVRATARHILRDLMKSGRVYGKNEGRFVREFSIQPFSDVNKNTEDQSVL